MEKNIQQIEKNAEDIRITVLTNTIIMLTERGIFKKEQLDDNIKKILSIKSDDMTYIMPIDTERYNNKEFIIKLIPQKITAINKSFGISDFLNTYKTTPKIIVVHEISKKALQFIMKNYPDTELFLEEELMINIIEHDIVPKHQILTTEEQWDVLQKYKLKKKQLPRIMNSDPIARYYNMKPGDICKITRPSEKAGYTVAYRLVIKGSNKT